MMFIGQIAMGDLAAEPAFEVVEQFGYFGRFKAAVGCPECLLKGLKVFQFWCFQYKQFNAQGRFDVWDL